MTCRAYRIGILPIAHNLSGIDRDNLNLAATKVVMASGEQDLLMLRETLGNAYPLAKGLMPREAMVLLRERIRRALHIRTFNSPASFFEIPDPQFLDEQSSKFRRSVPLVQPPLPVEVKPKDPAPNPKTESLPVEKASEEDEFSLLIPQHYVIIGVYRIFPFKNRKTLIEKIGELSEYDRMSPQSVRKYVKQLIQLNFFREVRISRGKGRPRVFMLPDSLGEAYFIKTFGKPFSRKKNRGGDDHLIITHNSADKLQLLYSEAVVKVGDTQTCKGTKIGEFDVVATIDDIKHILEVDLHANNLSRERVLEMLSISGVESLTIVCYPTKLEKNKQLMELDERISVEPVSNWID